MSKVIVTRQSYWHEEGALAVEIAARLDCSGPGALTERYPDEFFESEDPREIAEAAIRLAAAWSADLEHMPVPITLAMNDLVYPAVDDGMDPDEVRAWAIERFAAMPKCERCGAVEDVQTWTSSETGDQVQTCGQFCADELLVVEFEPES